RVDQRRMGGGQFRVLDGEVVGLAQGVHRWPDQRVVHRVRLFLAEQEQAQRPTAQGVEVILAGVDGREACPAFGGTFQFAFRLGNGVHDSSSNQAESGA